MRVVFYDDPNSDSDVWECDLPSPPRIGDMVSYLAPNGDRRVGIVTGVEWVMGEDETIIDVIINLM